MIYDFRVYTLEPGTTPDYMAGVRELGLPIRQRHGMADTSATRSTTCTRPPKNRAWRCRPFRAWRKT